MSQTTQEHEVLFGLTSHLLDVITLSFDWDELALSLSHLGQFLPLHFTHEEELWSQSPMLDGHAVTRLVDQHAELLAVVRKLHLLVEERHDADAVKREYLDWLKVLEEHESSERALTGD